MQRSRHVAAAARMMVKDTESGVEFPLGQRFWWVTATMMELSACLAISILLQFDIYIMFESASTALGGLL